MKDGWQAQQSHSFADVPSMPQAITPAQSSLLWSLAERYGTPLWVYDAAVIRRQVAALKSFDAIRFAQKACSNTRPRES